MLKPKSLSFPRHHHNHDHHQKGSQPQRNNAHHRLLHIYSLSLFAYLLFLLVHFRFYFLFQKTILVFSKQDGG